MFPALVLFLSHPLLPAVGAQNLELRENVKDVKSVGSDPSYASESPGKLAKLQTCRSHPWRCLSLVGNGKRGSVCLASTPGDSDTASPPWSSEWQLVQVLWCRPGRLPYKMQVVQLQLLQVSPPRWCSLPAGATHSPWGGLAVGHFFSFILFCSPGPHRKTALPFLCGQPSHVMTAFPSHPGLSSPAYTPLLLLMLSRRLHLPIGAWEENRGAEPSDGSWEPTRSRAPNSLAEPGQSFLPNPTRYPLLSVSE